MNVTIISDNDISEILALQKISYISEAKLVDNYLIPPLTQTPEELKEDILNGTVVFKATCNNGTILGSVRGYIIEDTLYIGRLFVDPNHQNKGIGTKLLNEIEKYFSCSRCELYTSDKSLKNLGIYIKNGYAEFKREEENGVTFVYLEKSKCS